jgi:hypothetical protein
MLVLLCKAARRKQQYKSCNDSSPDHFTPPTLRDYSPDSKGTRRRHLGRKPIIRVFRHQFRVTAYPLQLPLAHYPPRSSQFLVGLLPESRSAYKSGSDGRKTGMSDKSFRRPSGPCEDALRRAK